MNATEALEEFYQHDIPSYIIRAGKTYLTVRISDWQGTRNLKVTINDVVTYYRFQAGNSSSGIRTLAGHSVDWRYIDNLAKEALAWFTHINIAALKREGKKAGLDARF